MANQRYYDSQGLIGIVLSNSERGWSTYSGNYKVASSLLFNASIVELVLEGCSDTEINNYCSKKYPVSYSKPPGPLDLRVEFIPEGKQFIVLCGPFGEFIHVLFMENLPIYTS